MVGSTEATEKKSLVPQRHGWNGERNRYRIMTDGDVRNSFLSGGKSLLCFLLSDVFEKALFEMSEQGFFV